MHNPPGEQATCGLGALSMQDLGEKKANMVAVQQNEGALGGGQRALCLVVSMSDAGQAAPWQESSPAPGPETGQTRVAELRVQSGWAGARVCSWSGAVAGWEEQPGPESRDFQYADESRVSRGKDVRSDHEMHRIHVLTPVLGRKTGLPKAASRRRVPQA